MKPPRAVSKSHNCQIWSAVDSGPSLTDHPRDGARQVVRLLHRLAYCTPAEWRRLCVGAASTAAVVVGELRMPSDRREVHDFAGLALDAPIGPGDATTLDVTLLHAGVPGVVNVVAAVVALGWRGQLAPSTFRQLYAGVGAVVPLDTLEDA